MRGCLCFLIRLLLRNQRALHPHPPHMINRSIHNQFLFPPPQSIHPNPPTPLHNPRNPTIIPINHHPPGHLRVPPPRHARLPRRARRPVPLRGRHLVALRLHHHLLGLQFRQALALVFFSLKYSLVALLTFNSGRHHGAIVVIVGF